MDDRAQSGVVGEILLIAVGVTMVAALVFVWDDASAGQPAPRAMGLHRDAGSTSTTATYVVNAYAAPAPPWSALTVKIDGVTAAYDGTLSASPSFCVGVSSTCVATGSWSPETTFVEAGQRVRVHHDALAGKTVTLTDERANALVASLTMP